MPDCFGERLCFIGVGIYLTAQFDNYHSLNFGILLLSLVVIDFPFHKNLAEALVASAYRPSQILTIW